MNYELSPEQHRNFWYKKYDHLNPASSCARKHIWDTTFKPIYNIDYSESPYGATEIIGFYGFLKGDEKHINWFILKEL